MKLNKQDKCALGLLVGVYALGRSIDTVMSAYYVDGVNYIELNPLYYHIGFSGIFVLSLIIFAVLLSILKLVYLEKFESKPLFFAVLGLCVGMSWFPIFNNAIQLGWIYS